MCQEIQVGYMSKVMSFKSCKSRLLHYEEVPCFTTWRWRGWSMESKSHPPSAEHISVCMKERYYFVNWKKQPTGPHFEIKHCDSIDTFAWYNFVNLHGSHCGRETIGDYKTHETCYSINKKHINDVRLKHIVVIICYHMMQIPVVVIL
jgi:hypothetical protein